MRKTDKAVVDNPIVQRIIDTLKIRSIKQNELIEYLGLGNGTFTSWKYDGGQSYMKYLDEIARFLNVSRDYLLYGTEEESLQFRPMPGEIELLQKMRSLTDRERRYVNHTIDFLLESRKA